MGALHVGLSLVLSDCVPSGNEGHAPTRLVVLIIVTYILGPSGGLTLMVLYPSLIIMWFPIGVVICFVMVGTGGLV